MEYASNEIQNMEHEHEKGNMGHSPYMKSGIWNHEIYPILEYGKSENMKLRTLNRVILKFELGNLHDPLGLLGSPLTQVLNTQKRGMHFLKLKLSLSVTCDG